MEEARNTMKKHLSLLLVLALILGTFANTTFASAATKLSSWSFKTKSGQTIDVDGHINMQKNEFQDFNIYKSGKEIKQNDTSRTITWSSSDENIVWIDPSNGKARADKLKKMTGDYGEAVITATIRNKVTKAVTRRTFNVSVGTKGPVVDHITLGFKDGMDASQTLKLDTSYTLETLVYDKDNKQLAAEDHKLFFAYFCDKVGITISGATIKPVQDGEYTITVGAFDTAAKASAATSAEDALFTAELKNLVVEANKPKITEIRQVDLYTVALTFNKPEYAKSLTENSNLLSGTYDLYGYPNLVDFQEILVEDDNPSTVLVRLYTGLTEGITYTFSYKGTETTSASVTGSGTKPAQIKLVSESVEAERDYHFKVAILNNKGVDITEAVGFQYVPTFEALDSDFAQPYILDGDSLYFFEAGQAATIRATLNLGYDNYGQPLTPLYATARFTSIPKFQPIIGTCNGFAYATADASAESLTYSPTVKTICANDYNIYLFATYPYIDEDRETHTRYIFNGNDTEDGSLIYTYKSSNPNVLEVDTYSGMLYPFTKGSATIYILDADNKPVGTAPVTITDARTLTNFTVTNQSAVKLSATGDPNPTDKEFITLKLNATDQLNEAFPTAYSFAVTEPTNVAFSFDTLFNHSIDGNTLKIWERPGLADAITAINPKNPICRFKIEVTAIGGDKIFTKPFYITVKKVDPTAMPSKSQLTISKTSIDLKLNQDSLSNYESIIQVVSTDSSGYFLRCENINRIHNAADASTAKDVYSVLILYNNANVKDSDLPISSSGDRLVLKPVTSSGGDAIKKAPTGTYSVRLYKGDGTKARPLTNQNIVLTDTSADVKVSVKTREIADSNYATIKNALSIKRGNTDISSYVTIEDMTSRKVNNTFQVSELVLQVKVKEFNSNWPNDEEYTTVTLKGLNLQFKLKN